MLYTAKRSPNATTHFQNCHYVNLHEHCVSNNIPILIYYQELWTAVRATILRQIMAEVYLPHKVDQRQGRWSLNCTKRKFLSNHSWCHGIEPQPIYLFFFMPNLLPNSRMILNFREQTICVYFHELTICFLAKYSTCLEKKTRYGSNE